MFCVAPWKMAKSTTPNSADNHFALDKIRRFAHSELHDLLQTPSSLPLCYQSGSDVWVAKYHIHKISDRCWQVQCQKQDIFDFFVRQNAIFYCIAMYKNHLQTAAAIQKYDRQLNCLEFEAILYRKRYNTACQASDNWAVGFYSVQYEETQHRISQIKKQLRKTLQMTKYMTSN